MRMGWVSLAMIWLGFIGLVLVFLKGTKRRCRHRWNYWKKISFGGRWKTGKTCNKCFKVVNLN
jgi:hypothetical protein